MSVGGSSPGRRRLPFAARPQRGGGGGGGVRPAPCRGPPRRLGFLPRPAPPQTTPRPVGAGGSPRGRVARVAAPRGCVPRWWPAGRRGVLPPPRASPRAAAARCLVPPSPRGFGVAPGGWVPGFQPPVGRGASWPHTRVRLRGGREGEAGGAPGGRGATAGFFFSLLPRLPPSSSSCACPPRRGACVPPGRWGLSAWSSLCAFPCRAPPRPPVPVPAGSCFPVPPPVCVPFCLPPPAPPPRLSGWGRGGVGEPGGWRLDRGSVLARGSRTVSPSHLAGALFPARGRASERADERGGADRAVRARVPSVPSVPPARFALRPSETRPQIRRGDPLNLSILVSGGKETNQDSLSNGE